MTSYSLGDFQIGYFWLGGFVMYPLYYLFNPIPRTQAVEFRVLIDFGTEVNAITPAFAVELGLFTRQIEISIEKIDISTQNIYGMVIIGFLIQNKLGKIRYYEENFLSVNTSMNVFFKMRIMAFNNKIIQFTTKCFTWKTYSTAEILAIARQLEFIDKYKFAKAALDKNFEKFVMYITDLKILELAIHLARTLLLAPL